jgi:PAS domain S-box-containing protein
LDQFRPHIILSDFSIPGFSGLEALEIAHGLHSDIPFIFVSGMIGEENAVNALKSGATDYVLKGNLLRLPAAVERAVKEAEERRRLQALERDLRESERRLSSMLGNIKFISIMFDRHANLTYCNDYFLALTGWRREEVLGRNWFELFVPPGLVDLRGTFTALLVDLPRTWHHENEILTRSGEFRLVRWNNSVLRSTTGEVVGTASIGEDITEREGAAKALRESEANFRELIEEASDGIFITDAQGKFTLVNTSGCGLLGYTQKELVGADAEVTYVEEERFVHKKRLEQVRGGARLRFERMFRRKDGSTFPAEVSAKMLNNGSVQVIFHDITQRVNDGPKSLHTS